jgi:hypothetical protein
MSAMPNRHINLFRPALRPRRDRLTLGRAVALSVLAATGMLGWWVVLEQSLVQQKQLLSSLESQVRQSQTEQTRLTAMAGRKKDPALQARLGETEAQLRQKQALLEKLRQGGAGMERMSSDERFSEVMLALARRRTEGVWITGFSVSAAAGPLQIQGRANAAELLPQYMAQLGRDNVLRGRVISDLRLNERSITTSPSNDPGPASLERPAPVTQRFVEFSLGGSGSAGGGASDTAPGVAGNARPAAASANATGAR